MARRPWQETAIYLAARGGLTVTQIAQHPDVNKSRQAVSSFLNDPDIRQEVDAYTEERAKQYRQQATEIDSQRHKAEELAWRHVMDVLNSDEADALFKEKTKVALSILEPVLDSDREAQAPINVQIEYVSNDD